MVMEHIGLRTSARVNFLKAADKNTMVSSQDHVAPPDAYRGGKEGELKTTQSHPEITCQMSLNVLNPRVTCGKEN
jgi:hypothetical protein